MVFSNRPRRKKGEQPALQDISRDDSGVSYSKTAPGSLSEQHIDAIQGRDISYYPDSYALLTSGPESNPTVMTIDDDYEQAVTEAVSTEDTSLTYIGMHN